MSKREVKYLWDAIERPSTRSISRYQLRRTVSNDDNDVPNMTAITKESAVAIAKTYTCPLTGKLLFNPVMVEGDRHFLYERKAIVKYIEQRGDDDGCIASPLTDGSISTKLVPAYQTRNAILHLATSGILDNYLTKEWKDVLKMRKRAEEGDAEAMVNQGFYYVDPEGNDSHSPSPEEEKQAYTWWKKAADLGNVEGMAEAGECLVEGLGVEQDTLQGIKLIESAARSGFCNARLSLALDFDMGLNGLQRDKEAARYWLRKALDGSCKWPLDEEEQEVAQRMLQELQEEE